jgi:hypothetical protein
MRAIGFVSASSLVMTALLVTDADAANIVGVQFIPDVALRTAPMQHNDSVWTGCSAPTPGADPIRSPGRRMGLAAAGRPVHRARTRGGN